MSSSSPTVTHIIFLKLLDTQKATNKGYLDDQWEEERLRFFTCGVFELHKHFHSNHGSMPAEDCLEA